MEINELPKGKKIIVFDGVCNLCDSVVKYVIARDKHDEFRFVAQQSELGKKILEHIGIDLKTVDSVVLYEPGVAYFYKSDAAIEIAKSLGGINAAMIALRILPKFLRDKLYAYVAKNRYKWYGKKDECLVPDLKIRSKFIG